MTSQASGNSKVVQNQPARAVTALPVVSGFSISDSYCMRSALDSFPHLLPPDEIPILLALQGLKDANLRGHENGSLDESQSINRMGGGLHLVWSKPMPSSCCSPPEPLAVPQTLVSHSSKVVLRKKQRADDFPSEWRERPVRSGCRRPPAQAKGFSETRTEYYPLILLPPSSTKGVTRWIVNTLNAKSSMRYGSNLLLF